MDTYNVLEDGNTFFDGTLVTLLSSNVNQRSKNKPGLYNSVIELLIANRFDLSLSIESVQINFVELELEISMLDFLKCGGFDESDEIYFVDDFMMRMHNYQVDGINYGTCDYEHSTFLQKLSLSKESEQIGRIEQSGPSLPPDLTEIQQLNHKITIGLTVGDLDLFNQFLNSFKSSFVGNLHKISLVICCFEVDKTDVENTLSKYQLNIESLTVLNEEWGYEKAELGVLGSWFLSEACRSGVSFGRCVLHRALYEYSKNEIIWILDDDIVFAKSNLKQLNESILIMKQQKHIVGIGAILGDAPLPPAYIIRTQAVDFFYASLASQDKDWRIHDNTMSSHDIHHDLSTSRTNHLEIPIGLRNAQNNSLTNWSIFSGKSITREIHSDWHRLDSIPTRGGNTLILDRFPLINWPNAAPYCGGVQFRRGDTIWARLIEIENPSIICPIPLSLNQIRTKDAESFGSVSSIRGDILGSMLTRLIGTDNYRAEEVVNNSKIRESRLIMNLIRAHFLLSSLNYDQNNLKILDEFISTIIDTSFSEQIEMELSEFIHKQDANIMDFRNNV